MTRVEKNILIAKFMGYTGNGDMEYLTHPETNYDHSINDKDWFLYDKSWDWLMPVLTKICFELERNDEYNGWWTNDFNPLENNLDILFERVIKYIQSK